MGVNAPRTASAASSTSSYTPYSFASTPTRPPRAPAGSPVAGIISGPTARELNLLGFHRDSPPPASFVDSVDAALAAYSASTVKSLYISLLDNCPCIPSPPHRAMVAPALCLQHMDFSSDLYLPSEWSLLPLPGVDGDEGSLSSPCVSERHEFGSPSEYNGSFSSVWPACSRR
ncbi:hypothetical protein ACP70R_005675 [Stipagrostis hirtigluma subsp. patula]